MPGLDFAHARYESESLHVAHIRRQLFACRGSNDVESTEEFAGVHEC